MCGPESPISSELAQVECIHEAACAAGEPESQLYGIKPWADELSSIQVPSSLHRFLAALLARHPKGAAKVEHPPVRCGGWGWGRGESVGLPEEAALAQGLRARRRLPPLRAWMQHPAAAAHLRLLHSQVPSCVPHGPPLPPTHAAQGVHGTHQCVGARHRVPLCGQCRAGAQFFGPKVHGVSGESCDIVGRAQCAAGTAVCAAETVRLGRGCGGASPMRPQHAACQKGTRQNLRLRSSPAGGRRYLPLHQGSPPNHTPPPPHRQRDEPLGSKLRRAMELAVQEQGEAFRAGAAAECELCGNTGAPAWKVFPCISGPRRTAAPGWAGSMGTLPAHLPPGASHRESPSCPAPAPCLLLSPCLQRPACEWIATTRPCCSCVPISWRPTPASSRPRSLQSHPAAARSSG